MNVPEIKSQLDVIDNSLMTSELAEYGAWDMSELANNEENRARLVWLAGCDIAE